MTRRSLVLLGAVGFLTACLMTASPAWADCQVLVVSKVSPIDGGSSGGNFISATPTGPFLLNREGLLERVADLLIYDDGSPNGNGSEPCFTANTQKIVLTYNVTLTRPVQINSAADDFIDVFDSNGANGLVMNVQTVSVGFGPGGTPQIVIDLLVLQSGTPGNPLSGPSGSAIRVKNIRVDANSLSNAGFATATVAATRGHLLQSPQTHNVGQAFDTIDGTSVNSGFGLQSVGGPLFNQASLSFSENFNVAFRPAGNTGVHKDINTTATSLLFEITNIPFGVSVTFPNQLVSSGLRFVAKSGCGTGLTNPGAPDVNSFDRVVACYETTVNNMAASDTMTIETAASAGNGTTTGVTPKIGVQIADPSGFSPTAFNDRGTPVDVRAVFGPGVPPAQFVGDDVSSTAIPRYVTSVSPTASLSRFILNSLNQSKGFFRIFPVRTVLLYPFATNILNFQTGISVANTGNDDMAFPKAPPTKSQTGKLTFLLFPSNQPKIVVDSTVPHLISQCRGLTATGLLAPGSVFSCSINNILEGAGRMDLVNGPDGGGFDGYVIVVAEFNFGHGFSVVFSPLNNGGGYSPTATNALVLGAGHRIDGIPEVLSH